jgi:PAS domain S-box-containing protein
MANNAAHRLLEYNGIELIGQHISAIIPADHLKILVEGYISSMGGWNNGRPSDTHAARGLKKTGEFIDVELSISECVIGGKTQSVIIMRDVSARKRAEEDLRKAKEEAEEATRLKDKFVSLVAHDLKSPLSSMMGFLQLFGENSSRPLDKDGKDVLMRVIESGRQLNRLIDDLLGLSRLKSGQLKLKMRFFDAKSFVAKICQDFSYSANDKNIKLINDVPDNSRIYADRTLLYEAIQNLITNAIKFCNAGDTVTFSVGVDGGTSIRVQDTGPGMPQDIVDRILKYEVSMSTAGTEGETGTGLGLRFVKDIMQMHGGDMEAECEPEKGCVFTLKIPSVKPRVLIVDDDKNFRFMVRHYLKNYDLELSEADDGATAVDILAGTKNMPHLIISDIEMPKMTGLDLLSYLQTRRDTSSIPVIIISGKHGMEIRDTVYGLGAKDFLTKQIDKDDFIPRVRRYVG